MKDRDRYDVSGLSEAQFEPGSGGKVLRNLLGIQSTKKMDNVEAKALEIATDELIRTVDAGHRFTAADICRFHKAWLGKIYAWAGTYRQINISKDDFPFAAAAQIPSLMALQAGLPLLDFGSISGKKKETYFAAVQAGLDKNYKPMERLFAEIIERSVAAS